MSSSIPLPSLPDSDAESDRTAASLVLPLGLERDPTWTDNYRTTEKQRRNNIFWDYPLDALKALEVPDTPTNDIWVPCEHSQTTLTRLFPHIKTNPRKIDDYKLLFAFQKTENGFIIMKGALQHRITGDIVMLVTTNMPRTEMKIFDQKKKRSHAEGWTVYGVHQIAPPCFWRAFKAC